MSELVKKKYEKILEIRVGSHLYGTNTPSSDEDFSGIIFPDEKEVFGFEKMEEIDESIISKNEFGKNTEEAVDKKYYELRKFMKLAMENNPNIIEQLFVNEKNIIYCDESGRELLENRHIFLHKGLYVKFNAYAKSQIHKMVLKPENYLNLIEARKVLCEYIGNDSIKDLYDKEQLRRSRMSVLDLEDFLSDTKFFIFNESFLQVGDIHLNKKLTVGNVLTYINNRLEKACNRKEYYEKYGFDLKFASQAIRLIYEGHTLLTKCDIQFPLPEHQKKRLLDIRAGKYCKDEIIGIAECMMEEVDFAYKTSKLPSKPRYDEIQSLLIKIMKRRFVI